MSSFLRAHREALTPEDVGLAAGTHRRVRGLRREEVALLANLSADYYGRLEQDRGIQPSAQVLRSLGRALRLTTAELDHLYRLAGVPVPDRTLSSDHVSPVLLRILDRLTDSPAQVMTDLGETLAQNRLAMVLFGDWSARSGLERNSTYRWFTDPDARSIYPPEMHAHESRARVAALRAAAGRRQDSLSRRLIDDLERNSSEFAALWKENEVDVRTTERKILMHPEVGRMEFDCQALSADAAGQQLVVFTAAPGSSTAQQLRLLDVIGIESV
jgi:transcriptional regulator with XRE-family HTH domain